MASGVKMEWLMEDAIHENSGVSLAKMILGIDVLSERLRILIALKPSIFLRERSSNWLEKNGCLWAQETHASFQKIIVTKPET